ncbi:MAG: hypothetical protein HW400_71 [Candidatus Levybacteria bacterium]|nr:hypothetical protein [Candidatus Levybacteria bacterium]
MMSPVRNRTHYKNMIRNKKLIKNNKTPRDASVYPRPISYGMRILLGTPVHECKDYAMERWLESVSKLNYPFDLLLIDNSENPGYVKKLRAYCKKYGITNYKLLHIDVARDAILDERLARCRELIRREILDKNYDAWFSLECDVIAPPDALSKLVNLIENYWMVSHAYPARGIPNGTNAELGISLIKQKALVRLGFSNEYGYVNPLLPNSRYGSDVWFIRRIDYASKGKRISVDGIIKPIYHLSH